MTKELQVLGKEDLDAAELMPATKDPEQIDEKMLEEIKTLGLDVSAFKTAYEKLENPIEAQKELAGILRAYVHVAIKNDLINQQKITESTRRWLSDYKSLLRDIQVAVNGTKHTELNFTQTVTHSDIAAKIRANQKDREEFEE